MNIGAHLAFLGSFRRMQWWAASIVMSIAILVAWLAVQWGHHPIRRTNAEIRKISSSKLDLRLNPADVPIELEELVASFNDMLARIEDGFVRLANFSADIAHELRTPVTNLTTQTEVALGQPRSAGEYREVLYSNLEELGRMSRMISDMLFLAQTENDRGNLRLTDVDLGELVKGVFEYFEAWAEDRRVSLQLLGTAGPVRADREMLLRALSNLVSNAIRHTPLDAAVTVKLVQDMSITTVTIENPGADSRRGSAAVVQPFLSRRSFAAAQGCGGRAGAGHRQVDRRSTRRLRTGPLGRQLDDLHDRPAFSPRTRCSVTSGVPMGLPQHSISVAPAS